MENWNWESSKRLPRKRRIVESLLRRKWASLTSKKWRIVNATTEESYDYELDDGSKSGFTEQSEFLVRCKNFYDPESDPRSWSNFYDPEFQEFATLRLWIAAKYTELYGYCGKRFLNDHLLKKDYALQSSTIQRFWLLPLRFWDLIFQSRSGILNHTGETYSLSGMMDYPRVLIMEWNLGQFPDSAEFQSWKLDFRTEVFLWTQPILKSQCFGSKKLRCRNQLTNLLHRDRLQGNIIFLISICLMRWLRQPWRSSSTRSQPSGERVSVEEQRAQNRFLRGRQIAYMIYEDFRATVQNDDVQDFDVRWDHALLSVSEMPSDPILEGL